MYTPVRRCRICGNTVLHLVLDLGEQVLTGVFPRDPDAHITKGPLQLVKCTGRNDSCGLLQLAHSYDLGEMYGENYGYRSGLNASMVRHLHATVAQICKRIDLRAGDLVVDIGSNDGTTLRAYPADLTLVGIDPTGTKFQNHYPEHVQLVPDYFSSRLLTKRFPNRKAKVVTSFSMFYDLEDPLHFMREVHEVLDDDGVWVFEQSYMPTMLAMNSFDTVCHEHLEYYALKQIKWMTDRVGFRIVDLEFNGVNGGSLSVTAAKGGSATPQTSLVEATLRAEREQGLDTLEPYVAFSERIALIKRDIRAFVEEAHSQGKTVAALGASTKGNVLLQHCGLTARDITMIGEVNPEKFGAYTPGTLIPIVAEDDVLARNPDFLLVLPWHFREFFVASDKYKDRALIFPLPKLEIVRC
jgi:hypothetical protein